MATLNRIMNLTEYIFHYYYYHTNNLSSEVGIEIV